MVPLETIIRSRDGSVETTVYRLAAGERGPRRSRLVCRWADGAMLAMTRAAPSGLWRRFTDAAGFCARTGLEGLRLDLEQLAPLRWAAVARDRGRSRLRLEWESAVPLEQLLLLGFARELGLAARTLGCPPRTPLLAVELARDGLHLVRRPLPCDRRLHARAASALRRMRANSGPAHNEAQDV